VRRLLPVAARLCVHLISQGEAMTSNDNTPAAGTPDTGTLRDWFAGIALGSMITAPSRPGVLVPTMDGMAVIAYDHADAMLRARELPPKPAPKAR
jgi:hypothetical protein